MRPIHLLASVLILIVAGACTSSERDGTSTTEYTDDIGRTVRIADPAERIVTLAPNLTEIVFAAGAGDRLVGVTTADDYPPEVQTLPRISAVPVDFESVALLRPDVVLATDQVNSPKDAASFESLDVPVYFFHFTSLEDIFAAIEVTGKIAGTAERAASHAATLRQALEDLKERTNPVANPPRVLFLISDEKLFGFGRGSYIHEIIRAAGGESVSADEELPAPVFNDEYVVEQQPDVIVGSFPPEVDAETLLKLHPAWGTVPAIRNDRVYAVNPDIVLRPGPRAIEGAYRLALILHPELLGSGSSATG